MNSTLVDLHLLEYHVIDNKLNVKNMLVYQVGLCYVDVTLISLEPSYYIVLSK